MGNDIGALDPRIKDMCKNADARESDCSELLAVQANSDEMQPVNSGHFHEIADRCHIVLSNIDDHIIDHPGMTEQMTRLCKEAQHCLSAVINLAWAERDELFPAR